MEIDLFSCTNEYVLGADWFKFCFVFHSYQEFALKPQVAFGVVAPLSFRD